MRLASKPLAKAEKYIWYLLGFALFGILWLTFTQMSTTYESELFKLREAHKVESQKLVEQLHLAETKVSDHERASLLFDH